MRHQKVGDRTLTHPAGAAAAGGRVAGALHEHTARHGMRVQLHDVAVVDLTTKQICIRRCFVVVCFLSLTTSSMVRRTNSKLSKMVRRSNWPLSRDKIVS